MKWKIDVFVAEKSYQKVDRFVPSVKKGVVKMTDQRITLGYMGTIQAFVNDNVEKTDDFIIGVVQEYYNEYGYHKQFELNGANLKAMIEKQIAKEHHHTKVSDINDSIRISICPSCLGIIYTHRDEYPNYCSNCGQKISWKDREV